MVGKGELIGRVEMILVLTGMATRLGEAVVQNDAATAGHMGRHASEDAAPLQIPIEAPIDKFPQKAAALRTPPAIGFFDAVTPLFERIRGTIGVRLGMLQEGEEVAHA